MTKQDVEKQFDAMVVKYTNKFVEVGGSPGAMNQCVDLANLWINEFLGLPKVLGTNAVDFPARIGDKFEFIKNEASNAPQKGDIVVWGKPYGKYTNSAGQVVFAGHIAICREGDANIFYSFDQNEPIGSKAHIQQHSYNGVIGWLRLKTSVATATEMLSISKADFERIRENSTKWDKTVAQLEVGTDPATTPFEAVQSVIGGIKSRSTDLSKQLAEAKAEVTNRTEQVSRLKDQLLSEQKAHNDAMVALNKQVKIAEDSVGSAEARSTDLQAKLNEMAISKGEVVTKLSTAETTAENWRIKYETLLSSKVEKLGFAERIAILFTGRLP